MKNSQRDATGRYDYSDFDHMCVCGHTLGQHSAERPRDCFVGTGIPGDTKDTPHCDCPKFRKKRVKK